jgi:hypothetical protein
MYSWVAVGFWQGPIMRFRNIGGKQVCFHRTMNYLYSKIAFENSCLHEFFSEIDFTTRSRVKKENVEAHWEFTDEHPCFETDVVVYRRTKCVPVEVARIDEGFRNVAGTPRRGRTP